MKSQKKLGNIRGGVLTASGDRRGSQEVPFSSTFVYCRESYLSTPASHEVEYS